MEHTTLYRGRHRDAGWMMGWDGGGSSMRLKAVQAGSPAVGMRERDKYRGKRKFSVIEGAGRTHGHGHRFLKSVRRNEFGCAACV